MEQKRKEQKGESTQDYSEKNKKAWEYNAYDFWVREVGTPPQRAEKIKKDPVGN